jgi:hypothetical protein
LARAAVPSLGETRALCAHACIELGARRRACGGARERRRRRAVGERLFLGRLQRRRARHGAVNAARDIFAQRAVGREQPLQALMRALCRVWRLRFRRVVRCGDARSPL